MKVKEDQIGKIERNMKFVRALTDALSVEEHVKEANHSRPQFQRGMERVIEALRKVINEHVE